MPAFKDHEANKRTKILIVGEGGAGKTSLAASLANADYNLRILDYDNGLNILKSYVEPDKIDNIIYRTCTGDGEIDAKGDEIVRAFAQGANLLFRGWKTSKDEDLGNIRDWTEKEVLIIDTGTYMGIAAQKAALRGVGKKCTDQLAQADWGTAQRLVENVLSLVNSSQVKCNVVILAHPTFVDDEYGSSKMFPNICGKGLNTRVSHYFNDMYRLDVKRKGQEFVRTFRTTSDHKMSLKNSAPKFIKPEEPADLAAIFAKLRQAADAGAS